MRLDRLVISRGGQVIRDIPFHDGLNLILDAPTDTGVKSGNSIGKTTVLRLVDYCLGSDGEDIWRDPEFKRVNQEVYDFLTGGNPVSVELTLTSMHGRRHTLWRSFRRAGSTKIEANVDGRNIVRISDYWGAVRTILFGSDASKPSLRQLTPKFVRSTAQKMSKTLYFLPEFTKKTDYESVHLFLFGFFELVILEERPRLATQKNRIQRDLDALRRLRSEGELQQLIRHLQAEIAQTEARIEVQGKLSGFTDSVKEIGDIRRRAATVSGQLAAIEAELKYQEKTIEQLTRAEANVDIELVRQLYQEAQVFIPELQKEFNELADFVKGLKKRKLDYLKSRLPETRQIFGRLRDELHQLNVREQVALVPIRSELDSPDLLTLREQLRDAYIKLGGLEESANSFARLRAEEERVDAALRETQRRLDESRGRLEKNVEIFNKHFSKLSKALYDETYLLHFDEDKKTGAFQFSISHVGSNVGTGKKATQTAAFDLAYIQFLQEMELDFPRFALHDGLEAIHGNQLEGLFFEAASSSGQLVVATLRDKLPKMDRQFVEKNTVLQLSQEDKLFGF